MSNISQSTAQGYLLSAVINSLYSVIMSGNITFSEKDKIVLLRQIEQIKKSIESNLYDKLDSTHPSQN